MIPVETDSQLGHHQASITLTRQRQSETSKQRVSATRFPSNLILTNCPPTIHDKLSRYVTVLRCSSFLPLPSPHDRIKIRRSTVEKCTNARRRKRGWKPPSSGVARRDFSIRSRDSSFANFEFRTLLLFPPKTIQFSSFLNFYLINVIRFLLLLLEEINLS